MLSKRIKSFFIDNKPKEQTKEIEEQKEEETKTLYAVKLKDKFLEQFPMNLKSYLAKDMKDSNKYIFIEKLYEEELYGIKVLFDKQEALTIIEKLNQLPLETERDPRFNYLDASTIVPGTIDASRILPDPDFPGMFKVKEESTEGENDNE